MVQTAPPSGPAMPPSRTPVTGDPMQKLLAIKANQGQPPGQVPPISTGGLSLPTEGGTPMPIFEPSSNVVNEESNLNNQLKKVAPLVAATLAENAVSSEVKTSAENDNRDREGMERMAMENMAMRTIGEAARNPTIAMESGGLIALAGGGGFSGQVPGIGHGMEDNVYMPIVERAAGEQVGTLAVSPDEYVVDAHTMSALGNGSADAGARVMDQAVKDIRQQAYGTNEQPNEISGLAALQPLIERV
jgi:hypothetical protein|tara:strand:+ start:465 stop:1202 length:738 start_codon:yes stop_codon:yes gene_type:complete